MVLFPGKAEAKAVIKPMWDALMEGVGGAQTVHPSAQYRSGAPGDYGDSLKLTLFHIFYIVYHDCTALSVRFNSSSRIVQI